MTLEEKVGQLLMARSGPAAFRALDSDDLADVRRAITEFHVGSLHVGIGDAAVIALTLNEMQRLAKVPLLTAHNLEGGAGFVLYGATRTPLAMAMAATGDEKLVYDIARVTAQEGRALGVNVNFYPVADVNNNPENPIINIRSFGEDPASVSRFVAAYIRGIQENGQLATAKHFPGHGDVSKDSHLTMPVLDVSRERLQSMELPPFRSAVEAGVGAMMTAHIWLPQLESEANLPSTLSRPILTTLLRDDLRFEGVLFTDSMSMRGVSASFANDDATIRAIEAGSDIIVTPPKLEESYNALLGAVRSGRITQQRLDQSVRRILTAKSKLGLQKNRLVDVNTLMTKVGTAENRAVAQKLADNAITLLKDDARVLPLRPSPDTRVMQLNVIDTRAGWREGTVGRVVTTELAKRFPRAVTVTIDDGSTASEFGLVRKLAALSDVIVVNGFIRVAEYKGSIRMNVDQMTLVRDLAALKKPFVFTAFGSPYVLQDIPELPAYAVTYDISSTAEVAAIKAITGEIPYKGRLPINMPGHFAIGHCLCSGATSRHTILMSGNPAGEQVTTLLPSGERRIHYEYNDRGRGPVLDTVIRPDGSMRITGKDYLKNDVTEEFSIANGRAKWSSKTEQGEAAADPARFYYSMNGPPAELGDLAKALLAAPSRCVKLLPAGEACIEKGGRLREATQYAITGLGFEPYLLWLDEENNLFAIADTFQSVVKSGSESLIPELARLDDEERNRRRASQTATLRHTPKRPLVITHARVFNSKTRAVDDDMTVIIEGNRILGVEHSPGVVPPPDAEIIDAADRMLLPGLWDMHFHRSSAEGVLNLAAGVTSVRSLGDDFTTIVSFKKAIDDGSIVGPRVVLVGFIDGSGPYKISTDIADTEAEARALIDRYAGAGFEGIKIYSSIKPELVPFLIRYSHEKNMRISGHVPAGMFAEQLVRLGFDEIQHTNMLFLNFYKDVTDTRTPLRFTAVGDRGADLDLQSREVRDFIALLKEKNVVIDPTLGAFQGLLLARPGKPYPSLAAAADRLPITIQRGLNTGGLPVDDAKDQRYRASYQRMLDFVAELWRQGVPLVAGTDSMPGFALHHELELWVRAGIPAADVLSIATLGASRVARREKDLGSIEEGKLADMILVNGDPTKNIADIRRVVTTIKNGEVYDAAKLYESVGVKPVE
jgi:beta-glucosidase-like glycosyl hydrolase